MVVDSSALIALLLKEPEAGRCAALLATEGLKAMSAFNLLETALVISSRKGPAAGRELDLLVHRAEIEIVPLITEHVALAREAWSRFGKGRHAAGLNIGDCCSYALATFLGQPLLYKGEDFAQTDIDGLRL